MMNAFNNRLSKENDQYAGTGGISENNQQAAFLPAFMNALTGEVLLSCNANGERATFHRLDGLPQEWLIDNELKNSVISGFVRLGQFFNRQQAADFIAQQSA